MPLRFSTHHHHNYCTPSRSGGAKWCISCMLIASLSLDAWCSSKAISHTSPTVCEWIVAFEVVDLKLSHLECSHLSLVQHEAFYDGEWPSMRLSTEVNGAQRLLRYWTSPLIHAYIRWWTYVLRYHLIVEQLLHPKDIPKSFVLSDLLFGSLNRWHRKKIFPRSSRPYMNSEVLTDLHYEHHSPCFFLRTLDGYMNLAVFGVSYALAAYLDMC